MARKTDTVDMDGDEEVLVSIKADDKSVPKAPEGMRYVGYCRKCRDFVELGPTFGDLKGGHPKSDIAVALLIGKDEPCPHLPRFNIGAMFMPALWGPVHGQWYMILMYPVWLELDNLLYTAVHNPSVGSYILAIGCIVACAAFTLLYARYANGWGYMRVAAERTPEEYLARERRWTILFVIIAVVLLVFATWYNLAIRPGLE